MSPNQTYYIFALTEVVARSCETVRPILPSDEHPATPARHKKVRGPCSARYDDGQHRSCAARAGKRVFFSTTPNTQKLWDQYHRGLAQHVGVAPRASYPDVMTKASKTALKKFGAAYENLAIVAH